MIILELFDTAPTEKLDFDLVDDLMFFMKASPAFYRKHFYPTIEKFHSRCKNNQVPDASFFKPLVSSAYKVYVNKYNLNELDDELPVDMLKEICLKLKHAELQSFKDRRKEK